MADESTISEREMSARKLREYDETKSDLEDARKWADSVIQDARGQVVSLPFQGKPATYEHPGDTFAGLPVLHRRGDAVLVHRPDQDYPEWIETLPFAAGSTREGAAPAPAVFAERESTTAGKKYDAGKLRYDLIPPEVEEAIADIFTYGAEKYGDRNWENGIKYSRLYAAARRHMQDWRRMRRIDDESGKPHLAHAIVNLIMLLKFELSTKGDSLNDFHYDAA